MNATAKNPATQGFLNLLLTSGVLKFGDFVTKSGRQSPYFFNTGNIYTGKTLGQMADFYAQIIAEKFSSGNAKNLFGPAYKGILLAAMTSERLHAKYGIDYTYTFNRKEIKDHGEGGNLIGYPYKGGEEVIIVEDVLTAGTSIRESMQLLKAYKVKVIGVVLGIDRCEKGQSAVSAKNEIEQTYALPVHSVIDLHTIFSLLKTKPEMRPAEWHADLENRIAAYLRAYCQGPVP